MCRQDLLLLDQSPETIFPPVLWDTQMPKDLPWACRTAMLCSPQPSAELFPPPHSALASLLGGYSQGKGNDKISLLC